MKNAELYEFAETHLGEKLAKKEKTKLDKWQKAYKVYDKTKPENAITTKWSFAKTPLFRCAMAMSLVVVLCLSIVLPIVLRDTDNGGPNDPHTFFFSPSPQDFVDVDAFHYALYNTRGITFFEDIVGMFDCEYATAIYEICEKSGLILSYILSEFELFLLGTSGLHIFSPVEFRVIFEGVEDYTTQFDGWRDFYLLPHSQTTGGFVVRFQYSEPDNFAWITFECDYHWYGITLQGFEAAGFYIEDKQIIIDLIDQIFNN